MTDRDIKRLKRYQLLINLCKVPMNRYELAEHTDVGFETIYADCMYLIKQGFMKKDRNKRSINAKPILLFISLVDKYPVDDFIPTSILRKLSSINNGTKVGRTVNGYESHSEWINGSNVTHHRLDDYDKKTKTYKHQEQYNHQARLTAKKSYFTGISGASMSML
jgi:hypothetical protein